MKFTASFFFQDNRDRLRCEMIRAYRNVTANTNTTRSLTVYCRGGRIVVSRDLFVNYRDVPNRDETRGKTEWDEAQGPGVYVGRGECTQTYKQTYIEVMGRSDCMQICVQTHILKPCSHVSSALTLLN